MQIFTPVTRTDLKARVQSLRLWLMEVVAWMVEAIGFRKGRIALNKHRLEARRELRELIFLMMCARMRFRKADKRRRWMGPPSTPRGFRYVQKTHRHGAALHARDHAEEFRCDTQSAR
jgi:hypothetical protein